MTQTISDANRNTYLRKARQGVKLYLSVYRPDTVWEGTLNSIPVYPAATLTVTTTSGTITNALAGHTLQVYSSAGLYKGWARLRAAGSGTTIYIMEVGQGHIDFDGGDVLKAYPWRRPIAKFHKYDAAANDWDVDYNVNYSDQHEDYGPIARMGPPCVGFRDGSGNYQGEFVGEYSAAYTPSDSIGTYAWAGPDAFASASAGTSGSPVLHTFTSAMPKGEEVTLTVTESGSGKTHTRYGIVFTHDLDGTNAPYRVAQASLDGTLGLGWGAQIILYGAYDEDALPRGARIVLWGVIKYGSTTRTNLGGTYPRRSHVLFDGYIIDEVQVVTGQTGQMGTEIQAATVDEVLRRASAYPVVQKNKATPSKWKHFENLTVQRGMLSWYKYRASLDMHDIYFGNYADTEIIKYLDPPPGTLWEQFEYFYPNTLMGMSGSSAVSSLHGDAWHQVTPEADKWLSTPALNIEQADLLGYPDGELRIDYTEYESSALESVSGVDFDAPLFSQSPGDLMGYWGGKTDQPPGFAPVDQSDLNEQTGKLRAYKNRKIARIEIPLAYFVPIDPNPQTLVNLTLAAAYHPRGYTDFASGMDLLVTKVSHDFRDDGLALTTLECEPQIGDVPDGVTVEVPVDPPIDWPEPPPDWDYDWPIDDWPPPGDPGDPLTQGRMAACCVGGSYVTYNLTEVYTSGNVVWEPRNNGLPTSSLTDFYMGIYRFTHEADIWDAFALIGSSDTSTSGIYRKVDFWNPTTAWELVYSVDTLRAAIGGTVTYPTNTDGPYHFAKIQAVGQYLYVLVTYESGGSTHRRFLVYNGSTWSLKTVFDTYTTAGERPCIPTAFTASGQNAGVVFTFLLDGSNHIRSAKSTDYGDTFATGYDFGAYSAGTEGTDINVPYEGNGSDNTVWAIRGNGTVYRSTNSGTSYSTVTMDTGWSGGGQRLHSYTSDSDVIAAISDDGDFQISTNGTAGTPTFTQKTGLGGVARFVGGWPVDANWFAIGMNDGTIQVSDDQGTTWYDATGNLTTYGVTRTLYCIPRAF